MKNLVWLLYGLGAVGLTLLIGVHNVPHNPLTYLYVGIGSIILRAYGR